MSLEDIAGLVAVWPNGSCRSLQAQMRVHLAGQISAVREQRARLDAFERQLQTVLGRLSARDPGPEQCGRGCSCETDLQLDAEDAAPGAEPWGCSLDPDALAARIGQRQEVAAAAASVEHADGGRSYHYLAGTLYGVRITALIDGGDELLVSLTAPATDAPRAASGPLAKVFRVTASECSLARVRRWRDEGTSCAPTSATTPPSCSPIPSWAATPLANHQHPSPARPASGQPLRISHHLTTANRPGPAVVSYQRRR